MIAMLEIDTLAEGNVRHGFFGRQGGVSSGIYASLNCGPGSNDDPIAIAENRRRAVVQLTGLAGRLATPWQVHGATALLIDSPWTDPAAPPQADALVTATPGLVVGVLTADCAPVLFADPQAGVVAAAHAGWRGALSGILEATVEAMLGAGARRHAISAAIGPCIGFANYEVGPEFRAAFLAADTSYIRHFVEQSDRKFRFDLPGFAASRLGSLGLKSVADARKCTYADAGAYFSFRRNTHQKVAEYGRQLSAIVAN